MRTALSRSLLRHLEPLAAISIFHLSGPTRERLAEGRLSIVAYPNDYGGFVHVGTEDTTPEEPDLAAIFRIARPAGVVWIKFDADAPAVDGLPAFDGAEDAP